MALKIQKLFIVESEGTNTKETFAVATIVLLIVALGFVIGQTFSALTYAQQQSYSTASSSGSVYRTATDDASQDRGPSYFSQTEVRPQDEPSILMPLLAIGAITTAGLGAYRIAKIMFGR